MDFVTILRIGIWILSCAREGTRTDFHFICVYFGCFIGLTQWDAHLFACFLAICLHRLHLVNQQFLCLPTTNLSMLFLDKRNNLRSSFFDVIIVSFLFLCEWAQQVSACVYVCLCVTMSMNMIIVAIYTICRSSFASLNEEIMPNFTDFILYTHTYISHDSQIHRTFDVRIISNSLYF